MTGPPARAAVAIGALGAGPRGLSVPGGAIVTDRLTVVLAPVFGTARAKKPLTAASADAAATGRTINEMLSSHPELSAVFTLFRLAELLDPDHRPGAANALVDRALHRYGDQGDI